MYKKERLDNGIVVAAETIPFVRSVSFGVWIKNGSRNETKNLSGISHFIEHMLFKGTERRSAKQIADEMDAVGGQMNAFTTKEYTCFYTRTLDTHFDVAIDIISDMVLNSRFDDAEINRERNVVIEEINMIEDSPEDLLHDLVEASVFNGSDLALPVLGVKDSVQGFGREIFLDYFKSNYHPENMVIAVAGNFDPDDMIKKIDGAFGGLKRRNGFKKPEFSAAYLPAAAARDKDIEQVHVSISFPSIRLGMDEAYPLLILNTIFGGGMSSRLFQKIREEHGLSYSIYSHNSSFSDCGLFFIYAALAKDQVDRAVELILAEIKRLFTEKINVETLNKTKEQIKSNYVLSLESSASRMSSIGRSELMLGKVLSQEEMLSKIDAVGLDFIYEVAENIFIADKMSVAAVGDITRDELTGFRLA